LTLTGGTFDLGSYSQTVAQVTLNSGLIQNGSLLSNVGFLVQQGDVDAVLGGMGALVKDGPGTLTLRQSNLYSGGTTLNGGILTIASSERLANSGSLTVEGGTFDLGGFTETVGLLTVRGGQILNGTLVASAFNVERGVVSTAFSGIGRLFKTTDALAELTGQSTYTGGTELVAGTLLLGDNNRLPVAGEVLVRSGLFDLNGFTQQSGTLTLGGGVIANGTLAASAYALQAGTISAVLSGTASVVKTTGGVVLLTAANTYTGTTTVGLAGGVEAGVLRLDLAGRLSNAATRVFAGTLDLNGTEQTIASLTLGGGASASVASVTLGGGSLRLGGDLSFDAANASGGAVVAGGTLDLGGIRTVSVASSANGAPDLTLDVRMVNGGLRKRSRGV
jgi:autotransporter-associated beta strand protein